MLYRRLWKITGLLASFLLAVPAAVGQISDCVAGGRKAGAPTTSPDGRYEVFKVFCTNETKEREMALVLRKVQSGETRTVYNYDRDVTVVWSPDSRWVAINDYAGSDYTNNVVVSIDRATPPIDLKQRLVQSKPKPRILESDHLYLSASQWKSESEIQLVVWGHDSGRQAAFCRCFLVSLSGSIRQCHLAVTGDDPEGYCESIKKDWRP